MKAHHKLAREKEFQSGIVIQPFADAVLIVQYKNIRAGMLTQRTRIMQSYSGLM